MPFQGIPELFTFCPVVRKMSEQSLLRISARDHFSYMIQEVSDCLETCLYTDLLIRCKDGFAIHAHKLVLAAASPFLKSLLDSNDHEEYQTLELPDTPQEDVNLLLEVVYRGLVEASIDELRRLVLLSHELFVSIPVSEELLSELDISLPSRRNYLQTPKSLPKLKLRPNGICIKEEEEKLPILVPLALQTGLSIVNTEYSSRNDDESQMLPESSSLTHMVHQNTCSICNASFTNLGNFRQHMQTHESDPLKEQRNNILTELVASGYVPRLSQFICNICNSSYNHAGNFKQHLLKHERDSGTISALLEAQNQDGSNSFLASVLQSAMTDRVNHGDGDLEKAAYVCQYCFRGFKHPGNFKQHLASHLRSGKLGLGEKRAVDENSTAQSGPSSKQLKTEQIWPCALCCSEFSNEENLQQHMNEEHIAADPERSSSPIAVDPDISYSICERCNESFETSEELSHHKLDCETRTLEDNGYIDWTTAFKNKPGKPPKPTIESPDKGGILGDALLKHCKICGKGFQKMCKLTAHLKIHSAPENHYRFPCDICGKKFTRPQHVTRHKLLHTGERPFNCPSCGKTFAREDKCKYHMKNECEKHRLLTLTMLHG